MTTHFICVFCGLLAVTGCVRDPTLGSGSWTGNEDNGSNIVWAMRTDVGYAVRFNSSDEQVHCSEANEFGTSTLVTLTFKALEAPGMVPVTAGPQSADVASAALGGLFTDGTFRLTDVDPIDATFDASAGPMHIAGELRAVPLCP